MTAVLVLATFAVFLLIDYLRGRKPVLAQAGAPARKAAAPPVLQPAYAGGFEVRPNLRYHPGHTWALAESPNFVRVGVDDFGARLIGQPSQVTIPKRGQWVRQGQKLATVLRDGGKAELVSPIEGEVTALNEAVVKDPSLLARDPYGEGWLVAVQAPDAVTNFRNLLSGTLARRWMDEAATRLRSHISQIATATAQDGGIVVQNLSDHLPSANWEELTREFFLT